MATKPARKAASTAASKRSGKVTSEAAPVAAPDFAAPDAAAASAPKAAAKSSSGAASRGRTAAKAADLPDDAVRTAFGEVVNMRADDLEAWLKTKESHVVGAKAGKTGTSESGPESVGHRSGRRIVALLGKSSSALTAGDVAHMRKVIGYVHRHLAQRPPGDVEHSRWRYSLMNWGHDPLR